MIDYSRPFLLLAALVALPVAAAEKQFDVSGFDELSVKGSPDVQLVQGTSESVTLSGDDDDIDKMRVYVEDGVLHIRPKERRGFWGSNLGKLEATVNFKSLSRIQSAGSGDLNAESFEGAELSVTTNGSGDIDIEDLAVASIDLNVNGSADIHLSGSAADQRIQINGSGDYQGLELVSETVALGINGSGDAAVYASKELSVAINGAGDVVYAGSPRISQRVWGSGEVRAKKAH